MKSNSRFDPQVGAFLFFGQLAGVFSATAVAIGIEGTINFSLIVSPSILSIAWLTGAICGLAMTPVAFYFLKDKKLKVMLPVMIITGTLVPLLPVAVEPSIRIAGTIVLWMIMIFFALRFGPAKDSSSNLEITGRSIIVSVILFWVCQSAWLVADPAYSVSEGERTVSALLFLSLYGISGGLIVSPIIEWATSRVQRTIFIMLSALGGVGLSVLASRFILPYYAEVSIILALVVVGLLLGTFLGIRRKQ